MEDFMKKRSLFVSIAAMSLLLSGLAACGNKPAEESQPAPATSEPAGQSSESKPSSQPKPSSSQQPATSQPAAHVHNYAKVGENVKNADGKDVYLMECADKDDKYIGIAFDDYAEKSADFGDTSGYTNVPEAMRNESHLLAKNSTISWKINVDKAVSGAKIAWGAVYTGSDHGTQKLAGKYSGSVNGGTAIAWEVDSDLTYDGAGLSQSTRAYVIAVTVDLIAGENIITLHQGNGGYRLLFGGEVRVHYAGDAVPVNAPEPDPEPDGYKVTFVPSAHVKVLVYPGVVAGDPEDTNNIAYTRDDSGNYAKYRAAGELEDDPATTDVDESEEVKPEINFKLVYEDGYYADGNNISISGTMGNEWNKLCSEDADAYSVTKIKADITITITEVAADENAPKGYVTTFTLEHCQLVVYEGKKNTDGTNIDVADADGKYYTRASGGAVSKAKAQMNFEIIPDSGYEFAHGLAKGAESSPIGVTSIVTGQFGNFKVDKKNINLISITKVATDLQIRVICTLIEAGE